MYLLISRGCDSKTMNRYSRFWCEIQRTAVKGSAKSGPVLENSTEPLNFCKPVKHDASIMMAMFSGISLFMSPIPQLITAGKIRPWLPGWFFLCLHPCGRRRGTWPQTVRGPDKFPLTASFQSKRRIFSNRSWLRR